LGKRGSIEDQKEFWIAVVIIDFLLTLVLIQVFPETDLFRILFGTTPISGFLAFVLLKIVHRRT
jgi:hypothetical protein